MVLAAACTTEPADPEGVVVTRVTRCASDPAGTVTVASLVEDSVDVDRLMHADVTPYTRHLASSSNPVTDLMDEDSWYGDDAHALRVEGSERVVMESFAPGALMRLWSADPEGRIRVYIDGATQPTIDADFPALMRGEVAPFVSPFAYVAGRGWNMVYPISWARSVKITLTATRIYYTVDYREYADDVVVEPFGAPETPAYTCARTRAVDTLRDGAEDPNTNATHALDSASPDAVATLAAHTGGSVVLLARLDLSTDDREVLSRTALVVHADGEKVIEIPLSAALASMSDAARVESLAISSGSGDYILRLPMPFRTSLTIALADRGGGRVTAQLDTATAPMDVTDATYRLYAAYVGPLYIDATVWPGQPDIATIAGGGRFVGLTYEIANGDPLYNWWGEGDPIISVDGATPMRGTGTEDHFLYAFCSTERFRSPYSGQTRANARDHGGLVTVYRFQVGDDIPFTSSFDFAFEVLPWGTHHERPIPIWLSTVTWFYARPGATFTGATGDATTYAPVTLPPEEIRTGDGHTTCG